MGVQNWPGQIFYPPVGMIAVMQSGTRIEIWDNESDDPGLFTGMNLRDGDASALWCRRFIAQVVEPTAEDMPHLSGHYGATTNTAHAFEVAVFAILDRLRPTTPTEGE